MLMVVLGPIFFKLRTWFCWHYPNVWWCYDKIWVGCLMFLSFGLVFWCSNVVLCPVLGLLWMLWRGLESLRGIRLLWRWKFSRPCYALGGLYYRGVAKAVGGIFYALCYRAFTALRIFLKPERRCRRCVAVDETKLKVECKGSPYTCSCELQGMWTRRRF